MADYREYTVEVALRGPIITGFQADTIFGHICWAIRFLKWTDDENDDRLKTFLDLYDNRRQAPPLFVSDGFPKGYLPKPLLPPITQRELDSVVLAENLVADSYKIKAVKKLEYMPIADFSKLNSSEMSYVPQYLI